MWHIIYSLVFLPTALLFPLLRGTKRVPPGDSSGLHCILHCPSQIYILQGFPETSPELTVYLPLRSSPN